MFLFFRVLSVNPVLTVYITVCSLLAGILCSKKEKSPPPCRLRLRWQSLTGASKAKDAPPRRSVAPPSPRLVHGSPPRRAPPGPSTPVSARPMASLCFRRRVRILLVAPAASPVPASRPVAARGRRILHLVAEPR
jgi:hypothetical protein